MYTNIFAFTTFNLGGQTYAISILLVPMSVISRYIFKKTYRNYILISALYTVRTRV